MELPETLKDWLQSGIQSGFVSKEEIVTDFSYELESLYGDEVPDDEEIEAVVNDIYDKYAHKEHGINFKRLKKVFDSLNKNKIIAIHNAGYTKQDGIYDAKEASKKIHACGVIPLGFCFYHQQDIERAMDDSIKSLYLCFDSINEDDDEAAAVGEKIVNLLLEEGFTVSWNHTIEQRIQINDFKWDKAYDNIDYGVGMAVEIMAEANRT